MPTAVQGIRLPRMVFFMLVPKRSTCIVSIAIQNLKQETEKLYRANLRDDSSTFLVLGGETEETERNKVIALSGVGVVAFFQQPVWGSEMAFLWQVGGERTEPRLMG